MSWEWLHEIEGAYVGAHAPIIDAINAIFGNKSGGSTTNPATQQTQKTTTYIIIVRDIVNAAVAGYLHWKKYRK